MKISRFYIVFLLAKVLLHLLRETRETKLRETTSVVNVNSSN